MTDEPMQYPRKDEVLVVYHNYKDEVRERRIRPIRFWYGKTKLHPKPGWVCTATDLERGVERDFSMAGFLAWGAEAVANYKATQAALVVAAGG